MAFLIRTSLRLLQHQNLLIPRIPSRPIIAAASLRPFSSSTSASSAGGGGGEHWTAKYRLRLGIPVICSIIAAASLLSYSSIPTKPSSGDGAAGERWNAKYRCCLGIGDSPVVLRVTEEWEPPQRGVVKINCTVSLAVGKTMVGKRTGEKFEYFCSFHGLARDSSADVIGLVVGYMKNPRNPMEMHLYALRGMGNLIQALREQGFHDGPFVLEVSTDFEEIVKCLALDDGCCNGEDEALLRDFMPDNLEDVDASSEIIVGDPEVMMKVWEAEGITKDLEDAGYVVLQTKYGYVVRRTKSGVDAGGN